MTRVEVRCCCAPAKLLGTLPIPSAQYSPSFTFVVMKSRSFDYRRPSGPWAAWPRTITLDLRLWSAPNAQGEMVQGFALKADGVPIETLRLIPGFIEAKVAE